MKRLSRNSCETGARTRRYKCRACGETYSRYLFRPEPAGGHYCDACLSDPVNMVKRQDAYWMAENAGRLLTGEKVA